GGMGVVYKAWQLSLKRVVALKMILAGDQAGAEELERFFQEAEAVARMEHPHIVKIHDIDRLARRPYFTTEFVDGGNLAQKMAGAPQPPPEAAQLIETLGRAVHFAHQRGIIHRDLKPANVLLTALGVPKITDFGLAKRVEAGPGLTQTGAIVGTPNYMAPEQARGTSKAQPLGPAVDIYALGVILYEMLTGRPPFQGESPLDTLQQALAVEPVSPRHLQPKLPRDLETICLKCLEKQPEKRYPSADELADDLRRFQAGEPIRARPVGALGRLRRWCRRKPLV